MKLSLMSNALLATGVLMLMVFAVFQMAGLGVDPLVPAGAAFLLGCTAILDRVGPQEIQ